MKKQDTKERLLKATLNLISEKGYLGATTREIALKAGVTELTLFRHFGTKEKLFEEVLSRYTFLPRLKELLPELDNLPYEDGLTRIGIKFVETLKERKSMVKIMQCEINMSKKIGVLHNRFVSELIKTLAGYFAMMQKKGIVRNISADLAAKVFFGTLFSYFHREEIVKGTDLTKKDIRKNITEFVDIFTKGTLNNHKR